MAEDSTTSPGYHGRRRASLPAISLHSSSSSSSGSHNSARRGRSTAADGIPDHRQEGRVRSAVAGRPVQPNRKHVGSSPRQMSAGYGKSHVTPRANSGQSVALSSSPPPTRSQRESPTAAPCYHSQARRHSVDVGVTSRNTSDDVEALQRAWASFCRVSSQKSFNANDYEKECPHGSSLFKSVLSELMEEDLTEYDLEEGNRDGRREASTSGCASRDSGTSHGEGDERHSHPRRARRRQVRFKSESDSDS